MTGNSPPPSTRLQKLALVLAVGMLVPVVLGVVKFGRHEPIGTTVAWAGAILAVAVFLLTGPWLEAAGPRLMTITLRVFGGLSVATVPVIVAGGFAGYIGEGTRSLPASITDPISQSAEVFAFARDSLSYSDSHHGKDEQWLEVKDTVTRQVERLLGPRARIFPESRSHRNRARALLGMGSQRGRIVARIEVEADTNRQGIGYPKLGLPVGTSYLFIDSLSYVPQMGDSVAIRAVIISATGATPIPKGFYRRYPNAWANYAQARWRFDPRDACMCEGCSSHGWCDICGF